MPPTTSLTVESWDLDRFTSWLATYGDRSPNTVESYRSDMLAFLRFAGTTRSPSDVGFDDVDAFVLHEARRGCSAVTVRRRLAGLRCYFGWLVSTGALASNPCADVRLAAPRSRALPEVLSRSEVRSLLTSLESDSVGDTRLAVAVLVATGLRVGELCAISVGDYDPERGSLTVMGKGRRQRVVFIGNEPLRFALHRHIRASSEARDAAVFRNRRGDRLTPAALRRALHAAAEVAGIERRVTPHLLRHTAATQLLEAGVDTRVIQRLLGHASISTTELYVRVSDEALRSAIEAADVVGAISAA